MDGLKPYKLKLVEEKAPQSALPFQGIFTIAKYMRSNNVQNTRFSPLRVAYSYYYEIVSNT